MRSEVVKMKAEVLKALLIYKLGVLILIFIMKTLEVTPPGMSLIVATLLLLKLLILIAARAS